VKPNRPDATNQSTVSRAADEEPGTTASEGPASETERCDLPSVTRALVDRLDQEAAQADGATGITPGRLRALARALGMSSDEPASETDPDRGN
jgi:hypothetical protein